MNNIDCSYYNYDDEAFDIKYPKANKSIPKSHIRIEAPEYWSCGYYHYSNPQSQNALITQTSGFPDSINPKKDNVTSAYSDRLSQWDYKHVNKVCAEFEVGGDQIWAYKLRALSGERLKQFAKEILKLDKMPTHVRVTHWYNVATGYSCPTITAIYPK